MAQERAENFKATAPVDTSQCQRSPEYETVIEVFTRNLYDPSKLGDVQALKSKHNCDIKNPTDAIKFANQEMGAIDPYSVLRTSAETEAFQLRIKGERLEIGASFYRPKTNDANFDKDPINVVNVIEGGPAQKAGLKDGDQLIAVDHKPIDAEQIGDALAPIYAAVDSPARLTVKRDGRTFDLDITSALVHVSSVTEKTLNDGIAYVRLNSFLSTSGPAELMGALNKHKSAKAVVLDLRDNPGGIVFNAVLATSLFMDHGVVSQARDRLDSSPKEPAFAQRTLFLTKDSSAYTINGDTTKYDRLPDVVDIPVAILVNEHSASASELFAGAMRDNGEAKLVGTQTFGKGVGQSYIPIPSLDGSLVVTSFEDTTPNGDWAGDGSKNRIGLKPDIEVKLPKGARYGSPEDTQLNAAVLYLKTQIAAGRKAR
ncbi:PDZ domain-containing protein [bacterium]|nr:PDZ domain-containing protein [bacterium]